MSKFAISLYVLSAALTVPALAEDIMQFREEPYNTSIIRPDAIGLYNSADQDITLFVRSDMSDSTEKRFNIPGKVRWILLGRPSSQYTIRIPTTGGRQVQYQLRVNNRYQIFWNPDAEVWDVGLIHER